MNALRGVGAKDVRLQGGWFSDKGIARKLQHSDFGGIPGLCQFCRVILPALRHAENGLSESAGVGARLDSAWWFLILEQGWFVPWRG